ncbi:scavenger receptor class F member 2-like [Saccostrea cucullata]|uniref:scavenger receptor class F member 2-like n=1 Tax=Saccostrea cuccullata TaxID=36930 RepID=UPI002ED235CE
MDTLEKTVSKSAANACKGCNRLNGNCENGCHPGWQGQLCLEECLNNFYGEGCNVSCGHCLNGKQCHHINGSCQSKCEPGYSGDKCDEVCMLGYFGTNCEQECSLYCKKSRDCHHASGICRGGCKKGWHGKDCMQDMEDDQIKSKVENLTTQVYSAFGASCVLFFLIGLFAVYKIVKRFKGIICRKSNFSSTSSFREKGAKTTSISMVEYENNFKDEYQELGDFCSPSNYDMLK